MSTRIPVATDGRSFSFWVAGRGAGNALTCSPVTRRPHGKKVVVRGKVEQPRLFSDAERTEDQIQYVVVCGGAGDRIQRTQRAIKIEQQHFMRNLTRHRILRRRERR